MPRRLKRRGSCLLWTGARNSCGYGVCRFEGRLVLAHRLAYYFAKGKIPRGKVVMHSCDTPLCCNPAHLSVGTQSQNISDAWSRTRKCRPRTLGE